MTGRPCTRPLLALGASMTQRAALTTQPWRSRRAPSGARRWRSPASALGCGNFGGVGSAPEFFGQGADEEQAFAIMDAAWELGIHHFDTADAYGGGRSEATIGRWIASRAVAPLLTTKTYNPMASGGDHGVAPERMARQLHSSLERLGVEQIDLYLTHDFDPDVAPALVRRGARGLPRRGADRRHRRLQLRRRAAACDPRRGSRRRDPELLLAAGARGRGRAARAVRGRAR